MWQNQRAEIFESSREPESRSSLSSEKDNDTHRSSSSITSTMSIMTILKSRARVCVYVFCAVDGPLVSQLRSECLYLDLPGVDKREISRSDIGLGTRTTEGFARGTATGGVPGVAEHQVH